MIITESTLVCYRCAIPFTVPQLFETKRREDHETFWCPNGHGQVFSAMSEAEKLRRELQASEERVRIARTETQGERMRAEKAERKLKRVHRGVCSNCNRSFTNLRRHMETKHGKDSPR